MSTILGMVDQNGNVIAGSGFTVNNSSTGTYKITFTTAFTSTPVVIASLTSDSLDSNQNNNILMVDPGTQSATVFITNQNSADGQDGGFTFFASNG